MHTFDLTGPLPATTTLLEASAGTGKTFAIAAMATRFLAERPDLDVTQLLMITFGRHAAGELRDRVFSRLKETLAYLDARAAGLPPAKQTDDVSEFLAATDLEERRARLAAAVERFNEATIVTTHAFCASMLRELGVLGDWDPDEGVGPDDRDLARQCATDVYLRLYRDTEKPPLEAKVALEVGEAACLTSLPLLPADGPRHDFAALTRELYAERKAVLGICSFDDVVHRLRDLLGDPAVGPLVRDRLRERFPVVLVDEFQDTDPPQWEVLDAAFVAPDRPTVLIGDPKQSIYGFRGADLGSYLRARDIAEVHTLGTNFRSDKPLVDAVVHLFRGAELGAADVTVDPVESDNPASLLEAPGTARLWLRRGAATGPGAVPVEAIDHDLVRMARSLCEKSRIDEKGKGPRPVAPGDIAVLVRTGARARAVRQALSDAGLPVILTGNQSVWKQEAADDWRMLLRAMGDPTQANIRLAALTPLIGSDLDRLLADQAEPARVSGLVREANLLFVDEGISAVVTLLRARADLDARLLADAEGPRRLTDLLHVAELLAASGIRTVPGLLALTARYSEDEEDADAIRVATDESGIRVMTLHAAKGLQFPIVLLPDTDGAAPQLNKPFPLVHDGTRHLWVGPRPGKGEDLMLAADRQALEEELRLLYVGLTRAAHLAIAWHLYRSGTKGDASPLTVLLKLQGTRRSGGGGLSGPMIAPGLIYDSALIPEKPEPAAFTVPRDLPALTTTPWTRRIDHTWRRTSYSGLTRGLHESAVPVLQDEDDELDITAAAPSDPALERPSPMADLPAGAAFGTLVHEAFERLDWAPEALAGSAAELMAELGPRDGLDRPAAEALAAALELACRTPLLPVTDLSLSDLPTSARLPELDFDLPLADRGAPATLDALADLMAAHLDPADPLSAYPARLAGSEAATESLNGFLTGSIDAVLRLPNGSFVVVDYKTNRLSPTAADPLLLAHYTPAAMAEAMMQAHYPLQAMLYCVALHRFLTLRLPGYDPARHLGGVGYLFVRGMAGPDTPVVDGTSCGVMGWFPPPALTVAASDLLGGIRA